MDLIELAEQHYQKFGEKISIIFNHEGYTNLRILKEANQLANGLIKLGIQPEDKVLVMLMNSPNVVISYQGILRAKGIIVPTIFLLGSKEVNHIMKNSEAKAIITSKDFLENVNEARKDVETMKHVIIVEDEEIPGTVSWMSICQRSSDERPDLDIKEDDLAVILYTSGTTGVLKGVMLTHKNLYMSALSSYKVDPDRDPKRVGLLVLPLSHSYGLMVMNTSFMYPNTSVMMSWFELEPACQLIEKYEINGFDGVPTIFALMLNSPNVTDKYDLSSIEQCVSGSAPLPVEILRGFEEKFSCEIYEGYGLSEASPAVTIHYPDRERKPGSIGQVIPDVEIKVVDERDQEVPVGEVGELIVKGGNVSQGYYKLPNQTNETFKNGWLYTGDMARMDEDGYVYIVDRKKDLIIRGGFNVIPRDVEEVLFKHSAVMDAAVVGVGDKVMGEEVKAYVVKQPDADINEAELINHCKEHLAGYKCPKYIQFVDALPRNPIGKVLRKELKEMKPK